MVTLVIAVILDGVVTLAIAGIRVLVLQATPVIRAILV